jgi:hypothetical protein
MINIPSERTGAISGKPGITLFSKEHVPGRFIHLSPGMFL